MSCQGKTSFVLGDSTVSLSLLLVDLSKIQHTRITFAPSRKRGKSRSCLFPAPGVDGLRVVISKNRAKQGMVIIGDTADTNSTLCIHYFEWPKPSSTGPIMTLPQS